VTTPSTVENKKYGVCNFDLSVFFSFLKMDIPFPEIASLCSVCSFFYSNDLLENNNQKWYLNRQIENATLLIKHR
jgi:hypothetical protein